MRDTKEQILLTALRQPLHAHGKAAVGDAPPPAEQPRRHRAHIIPLGIHHQLRYQPA